MTDRLARRNRFSNDPAYLAALEAAARSSVVSATTGLGQLSIASTPPPPPPSVPRALSSAAASDATPPPPPPAPKGGSDDARNAAAEPASAGPSSFNPSSSKGARGGTLRSAHGVGGGGGVIGRHHRSPVRGTSARGGRRSKSVSSSSSTSSRSSRASSSDSDSGLASAAKKRPAAAKGRARAAASGAAAATAAADVGPSTGGKARQRPVVAALPAEPHGNGSYAAGPGAIGRKPLRNESGSGADASAAQGGAGGAEVSKTVALGRYPEHLPQEDLQRGLKTGQLFRGKLRINASNRSEAYVTVEGLPHDLLIRGDLAQNRAIEGDEVAVALHPVSAWFVNNRLAAALQGPAGQGAGAAAAGGEAKGLAGAGGSRQRRPSKGLDDDTPWSSLHDPREVKDLVRELAEARPELRATAKVAAILTPSAKREHLVGLLQLASNPAASSAGPSTSGAASLVTPGMPPVIAAALASLTSGGGPQGLPTCYLMPLDPRMPRCVVRPSDVRNLPQALLEELLRGEGAEKRTLMSARIAEWSSAHTLPAVALRASLGQAGEIESETAALLEMEGVRHEEFTQEVLDCLPQLPWSIGPEELKGRRDFRFTRVLSIDPPTAKDLDDALSIEPLPGGGWRVGVHIADVAHFIPPYSALDVEAGQRATSVYLVQRVVPMLPPLLCEELCSLNPGVERLTFSVVWDMDAKGKVQSTWFGRSVIRSCAKLTYPLVQQMIEDRFDPTTCGVPLHGAGITWEQVIGDSLALWGLAKQMREARFAGGALKLDNCRLYYSLDPDGNPVSAAPYVTREANHLVEEFMLRANMSVAEYISETFPDRAMLRRHPPPNSTGKMKLLQDVAAAVGLPLDVTSAATIQEGLNAVRAAAAAAAAGDGSPAAAEAAAAAALIDNDGERDDADVEVVAEAAAAAAEVAVTAGVMTSDVARNRRMVELLVMFATRTMLLAEYFCTGLMDDERSWRHYALAVAHYTHFTSPIRRYPDVVVHRLLAAALDVRSGAATVEEAAAKHQLLDTRLAGLVADHCNSRRLSARNVQDGSLRLYLCVLLRRRPVITTATINNVGGDRFVAAYLTEFGQEIRLELSDAGVPLQARFDAGTKVLTITPATAAGDASGEGAAGRPKGGAGGRGRGRGGGGGAAGGSAASSGPSLDEWARSLAPVQNPHRLQPVSLPLHLRLFSEVPVILTSAMVPGQPSELEARIYLPQAEAAIKEVAAEAEAKKAAEGAKAAEAGTEGQAVRQGEIPWDSLLND